LLRKGKLTHSEADGEQQKNGHRSAADVNA
jgi:hypothetical protein